MKNKDIFLQFDFKQRGAQNVAPRFFSDPIDIIQRHDPDHIESAFKEIQAYLDKGFYAAGFASFELAYSLHQLPMPMKQNQLPLLWFAIFEAPKKTCQRKSGRFKVDDFQTNIDFNAYEKQSQKIHQAIYDGRIDEVNYTIPFQANLSGDSYTYYQQLSQAQKAGYGAYIQTEDFDILSASPELFYEVTNNIITMRPMKGTIHRGYDSEEDLALKRTLKHSEKDQYENLLTVDLMKADMKKVAIEDSIEITEKFTIEKYPTVYQMTSTIKGQVKAEKSLTDIFLHLFPCSSIAGVPNLESLALIQALEKTPREVYCGAIGYFSPTGDAIFNVPIRTVWLNRKNGKAYYGAGGGITKNSETSTEYTEVFTKTKVLSHQSPDFDLIETIGLSDGNYFILDYHLNRLEASLLYFDRPIDEFNKLRKALEEIKFSHSQGDYRVRVLVDQLGNFTISCHKLKKLANKKIVFAEKALDRKNIFLYHKTTYRDMFKNKDGDIETHILFWNEVGEVTEFAIGNIVIEKDGRLITPPLSSGLLPGTFRKKLLDEKTIEEALIYKEDVLAADKIWLINSVRQWVEMVF